MILNISPLSALASKFPNLKPATEFVPEWYRKSDSLMPNEKTALLPNNPIHTTSTYKKCTPLLDAMVNGYMVYLTSDIEVARTEDGFPMLLCRSVEQQILSFHPEIQWKGFQVPHGYYPAVYKFENNFIFNAPRGYSALFTHPLNRNDLPFRTIEGLVDIDKYDLPVNFPFFLKEGFLGILEAGTPIAQVHLIKREKWARQHLEFNEVGIKYAIEKFRTKIKRSYKVQYWTKKEYK